MNCLMQITQTLEKQNVVVLCADLYILFIFILLLFLYFLKLYLLYFK